MKAYTWYEKIKNNIRYINNDFKDFIESFGRKRLWKKETKNDRILLKHLNKELQPFHVKLHLDRRYRESPFPQNSAKAVPIVLKYARMCERKNSKIGLLSAFCSPQFHDAVPYLLDIYKDLIKDYHDFQSESDLTWVCETIEKIDSDKYIDQYIDLLKMPITPSAECIIRMLSKRKPLTPQIETCIVSLIEKESMIPETWIGEPNEDEKYWCSTLALDCIAKKGDPKYRSYLEKFLFPQDLPWIYFTESKYCRSNYSHCYKNYIKIATKGLRKIKDK